MVNTYNTLQTFQDGYLETKTYTILESGYLYNVLETSSNISSSTNIIVSYSNIQVIAINCTINNSSSVISEYAMLVSANSTINTNGSVISDYINQIGLSSSISVNSSVIDDCINSILINSTLNNNGDINNLPLLFKNNIPYSLLNSYSYSDLIYGKYILIKNFNVNIGSVANIDMQITNIISHDSSITSNAILNVEALELITVSCSISSSTAIQSNFINILSAITTVYSNSNVISDCLEQDYMNSNINTTANASNLPLIFSNSLPYNLLNSYSYIDLQSGKLTLISNINSNIISNTSISSETIKFINSSSNINFNTSLTAEDIKKIICYTDVINSNTIITDNIMSAIVSCNISSNCNVNGSANIIYGASSDISSIGKILELPYKYNLMLPYELVDNYTYLDLENGISLINIISASCTIDNTTTIELETNNYISANSTITSNTTISTSSIKFISSSTNINSVCTINTSITSYIEASSIIISNSDILKFPYKYSYNLSFGTLNNYKYLDLENGISPELLISLRTNLLSLTSLQIETVCNKEATGVITSTSNVISNCKSHGSKNKKILFVVMINKKYIIR